MTYLSDKQKRNKRLFRNVVFFVFVIALLFAWKPIRSVLYPLFTPIVNAYANTRDTGTGIPHAVITYFTSRSADQKKISELEANIERLENQIASSQFAGEEPGSTSTPKILKMTEKNVKTVELYPVVRDLSTLYNTVMLSKGFVDGIEENSIVYVRGFQAVGYISEVHNNTSTMTLYSAPDQKVEGVIKDIDASVTLEGQGGGSYIIEVPKTVGVAVGQVVYLSGNPTMPLGTIVEVHNDPQDTFTKAYVRGAYSPTEAHIFYVDQQI